MVVTVMKTTFPKAKPKTIQYKDMNFAEENFRIELRDSLQIDVIITKYEVIFVDVLNRYASPKKQFSELIINLIWTKVYARRSALENRYYWDKLPESNRAYQTNIYKKWKNKYFSNLNVCDYTDNKMVGNTTKPLFSNYAGGSQK